MVYNAELHPQAIIKRVSASSRLAILAEHKVVDTTSSI